MTAPTVAALYVDGAGPYIGLEGVEAWDLERDARQYRGPWPVVAHPPCKRWGRYWSGGPSAKERRHRGDDDGCFAAALWAVRTFGGVIEHPADSSAWDWFGLAHPPRLGWGWSAADRFEGRSCAVTQGRYGHAARKLTWLYAVLPSYPRLDWQDCSDKMPIEASFASAEDRRRARAAGVAPVKRMRAADLHITPKPFRDMLLAMVRG